MTGNVPFTEKKVEPSGAFFPLIIMFKAVLDLFFLDKNSSTFEVTYHETALGVEPFWLHFFLSVNLQVR